MRLTSLNIHFVLAALVSSMSLACDDGGDGGDATAGSGNTGNTGNMGGSGGGSGGGTGGAAPAPVGIVVSDFEAEGEGGVHDGYSEDTARMWKVAWFTYTDRAENKSDGAMITPAEAMRFIAVTDAGRGGGYVGNAKGGGFKAWGAGMGFNFVSPIDPLAAPGSTDLSAFKGVSFWIKANTATTGTVEIKLVDKQSTPAVRGGTCVAGMPMATSVCDDVHTAKAVPSAEWTLVTRRWIDFQQGGWGMRPFPAPDLAGVIGIQFQVSTVPAFDYSVDDVTLLTE